MAPRAWRFAPLVFAGAIAGCATGRFVAPVEIPIPVSLTEAEAAWGEATRDCRAVEAYGGEVRASVAIDSRRFPTLRLGLAVERDGRIAIDARVSGSSFFTLRGRGEAATLVLSQERQVVTGRVDEILDALAGLPIGPERLLAVLTGCLSLAPATTGERVGPFVRVTGPDAVVYLTRASGPWRVRAGSFGSLSVDYATRDGAWPSQIVLRSVAGRTPDVDVSLSIASFDRAPRDPSVFAVVTPAGAERISLETLRERGPLSRRGP